MLPFRIRTHGKLKNDYRDIGDRLVQIRAEKLITKRREQQWCGLATLKIEGLVSELQKQFTILIVTHNMQQAGRVSDYTAFMYMGEMVEYMRLNTRRSVDLPQPDGPMNAVT